MAVSKLGIYNDALRLLGQRSLASDTEDREPRYDLDALYDSGVDYCLQLVKPSFASRLAQVTGAAPTATTGYTYQAALPADFIQLLDVFADGKFETRVNKYEHEGSYILSDTDPVFIHYISDFATIGLTDMSNTFARFLSAYFARELANKYDPDETETITEEYKVRLKATIDEDQFHVKEELALDPITLSDDWRAIYNDALLILGLDPIKSNFDDSLRKNRLDISRVQGKVVESVLEDTGWHFGLITNQVFYDPGVDPAWGYQYACEKPATLHRLHGVWADEYMSAPIRDYIDEGGYIFTSYSVIYIQYVDNTFLTQPDLWPSYFRRMVAARMAVDAGNSIDDADLQNAVDQYKTRRKEAMSTDAIQSPPKTLSRGSWSRSRGYRRDRNRP